MENCREKRIEMEKELGIELYKEKDLSKLVSYNR